MKRKPTIPITTARATRRAQIACIRALAKSLIPMHLVAGRALEAVHGSLSRADARKAFDRAHTRIARHTAGCDAPDCEAARWLLGALEATMDGRYTVGHTFLGFAVECAAAVAYKEIT